MTDQERLLHRLPSKEHILQLFDTQESLASVVSAYLNEGWDGGEHLLIIAKSKHWNRITERLQRRGCPVSEAIDEGRITVLDAQATLARIMNAHEVDPALFHHALGSLVTRLSSASRGGLRIYGELVELLAEEGHFEGARTLENLWNALREAHTFTLLCGYSAAHFADARTARTLRAICACHTRVQRDSSDLLGSWLLADEHAEAADVG